MTGAALCARNHALSPVRSAACSTPHHAAVFFASLGPLTARKVFHPQRLDVHSFETSVLRAHLSAPGTLCDVEARAGVAGEGCVMYTSGSRERGKASVIKPGRC